ncbi:DUF2254 domain-containing protein [Arenibacter sp. 6A1]|uniref:DUF2254 domain-containing protein n=1 Tax=Arenibacter sp. 6A1 TaxID=2720391 RepID=UPI0014456B1E|nr:DUF2254 domain-containing protein [Arenibacter sp. 6A1]NKI26418.1 DUF2254 domain-containing protein [Arenibacter sp. 6A1]
MKNKIKAIFYRLREQLWFRPFIFCFFSVIAAFIAHLADATVLKDFVPSINTDSLEELLSTISASMLVISIFSVASMLSAFSAASNSATPRSFKLIIVDDVSQNALSVFIGSFIFSIIAKVALQNGLYGKAGNFVLFVITLGLFAIVILTFLQWVNRISRLGRLTNTIKKIEVAAAKAIKERIKSPTLKGIALTPKKKLGYPILSHNIGYLNRINLDFLQAIAEDLDATITLNRLPGSFIEPSTPIAFLHGHIAEDMDEISRKIDKAFSCDETRIFDEDPRFGIIALSEIASRALSPGINDPGTAIQIIGSLTRLFHLWAEPENKEETTSVSYDRIEVPEISMADLFEDAFRPIARDGATNIEVMIKLQKAFCSLAAMERADITSAAMYHSEMAYKRAEQHIKFEEDLKNLKEECLINKAV